MVNLKPMGIKLSSEEIFQVYLLLIAIMAVKLNEIDTIRGLANISATGIYILMGVTSVIYLITRKKMSSQLFMTIFLFFLLFLFNKLSRVIFLDEFELYNLEIGFVLFFFNFLILSKIQKESMIVNLLRIYIILTSAVVILVFFQDPSEYGKFNEKTNAFNFPFTPIGMNKNSFSLMLVMAGLSCVVLMKLQKWVFFNTFLLLIFSVFVLFLTTRSHLPLIFSTWVWLILGLKRYWNVVALLLFIFFILFGAIFFDNYDITLSRASDGTRYMMVVMSVGAFIDNPFTGQGVMLLLEQQQKFMTADHNQFSLFSGYFGIIGFVAIVFFILSVCRLFWGLDAINWFLLFSSFLVALSFTPFIYNYGCLIALTGVKLIAHYERENAENKRVT